MDKVNDFVYGTVTVAPTTPTEGGSVTISTEGTIRTPCDMVVYPAGQIPKRGNAEWWRVTANAGGKLTIARAQYGSSARSVQVGDQVMAGISATMWNALVSAIEAAEAALVGNYSFGGVKSFLLPPSAPAPLLPGDIANKAYVDSSAAGKRPRSMDYGYVLEGEVSERTSPPLPIEVLEGEEKNLMGIRCTLGAGTSIKVTVSVNGTNVPGLTNVLVKSSATETTATATEPISLKPGDKIRVQRSGITGGPCEDLVVNVVCSGAGSIAPSSALTYSGFTASQQPPPTWTPYGGGSLWNKPISKSEGEAAVHSDSANIVNYILTHHGAPQPGNMTVSDTYPGSHDFAHPVFYAATTDPEWTLHFTRETGNPNEGVKIKCPSFAKPAGGSDGHMIVIQPNGDEYDFYQVASGGPSAGKITAYWGSKTSLAGSGTGKTTAANFALMAGIIRPEELIAGTINHALFVVVSSCTQTLEFGHEIVDAHTAHPSEANYVWPATHGAAPEAGEHRPPTGARLWLAMSDAEINALGLPPYTKAIAMAMAHYGGYVGDTSGGGFGFQLLSQQTYSAAGLADPLYKYLEEQKALKVAETEPARNSYVMKPADTIPWASKLRVLNPPSKSEPI